MPRKHRKLKPHTPYRYDHDCERKATYQSQAEAESTRRHQESLNPGLKLRSYRCPKCSGWHLTRESA